MLLLHFRLASPLVLTIACSSTAKTVFCLLIVATNSHFIAHERGERWIVRHLTNRKAYVLIESGGGGEEENKLHSNKVIRFSMRIIWEIT